MNKLYRGSTGGGLALVLAEPGVRKLKSNQFESHSRLQFMKQHLRMEVSPSYKVKLENVKCF